MAPVITLYILGGCVAAAAVLFIVMLVLSVLRPPELPDLSPPPAFQRVMRALTPLPFAGAAFDGGPAGSFDAEAKTTLFRPRPPSPMAAPVSAPQRVAAGYAMPPASPAVAFAPTVRLQPPQPPPQPQLAPTVRLTAPQQQPAPQPPQYAARAYVVAPPAPPVAAPSPFAPSPFVWEAPPVQKPYVQVSPQPLSRAAVPQRAQRAISFPTFPSRRRPRIWLRVFLGVFIVGLLATSAVVAYPAMLDPHCDKYEWFGADAAKVVREHARDAHAAIADFIDSL